MRRDASVQVWLTEGTPPPDGVPHDLPESVTSKMGTPPNWFNEEPRYAAELYALERGIPAGHSGDYFVRVSVKDVHGDVTRWKVRLYRTVEASVTPDR